jgi:hypothetical protein
MKEDEIYFELCDAGDFVLIEPERYAIQDSEPDGNDNWIQSSVTIKAGAFFGRYRAEFMSTDFRSFRRELIALCDNLEGTARFSGLEGQLELCLLGDGLGHFEVKVVAIDQPGYGTELIFRMTIDQTSLKPVINQLSEILNKYPAVGGIGRQNE